MSTLAEIEAAMDRLSAEELSHLEARAREVRQRRASEPQSPSDLTEFAGSVWLDKDPLAFQRQIREEWE